MNIRQYIIALSLGSTICWFSFLLLLFQTDPFHASTGIFALFYATLFFSLLGTLSLFITTFFYFFDRSQTPLFIRVGQGFRRAAFVSIALITLLFLQSRQWLGVINLTAFFVCLLCIALFFHTRQKQDEFSLDTYTPSEDF